jgi:ArsR family transcriptional regulator
MAGYLPALGASITPLGRAYRCLSILTDADMMAGMGDDIGSEVRFLQALADPVRLSIVRQLAACAQVCACDFVECCTVSQPTISHHLRVLREAGIVTSERRGNNIMYALAPDFARRWSSIGAGLAGLVAVA